MNINFFFFFFFFFGGGGGGGGVRKLNIFWGMSILWILFGGGGHHKIGLYLEFISMHFRDFSEGQGTEWRIFFGLLKFQIFIWGA